VQITDLAALLNNPELRLILFIALVLVILLLLAALLLGRQIGRLESGRSVARQENLARQDAVKRSRAVLTGQIGEQLAPLLPDFPCDFAELRFLGKPVDYIAFPGLSAGAPDSVVFIEVKSGKSALSGTERALRDAIQAGRVYWKEYRIEP